MYVGLDVSKKNIVCVGQDKEGNIVYEGTFGTTKEGIDGLLNSVGKDSSFAVEASTNGVFVYDCLAANNMTVQMVNPNKLREIAESEKKTDREDAKVIAKHLRMNDLPTCYVPDKRTREVRDIIRQRKCMVEMRTALKNKIRAILAREGIDLPYTDVLGDEALLELDSIGLENKVQQEALHRLVHVAGVLTSEIWDYDQKIEETYEVSKYTKLLDTIPGISHYSAVHIASSIADISRFPTHNELASYAGLAPIVRQSGERRRDGGLKRKSDKQLRWILIQDAHGAVKRKGKLRKYYLKKVRKKGEQDAIVAVARKLVKIIHHMLTKGEPYSENYGK